MQGTVFYWLWNPVLCLWEKSILIMPDSSRIIWAAVGFRSITRGVKSPNQKKTREENWVSCCWDAKAKMDGTQKATNFGNKEFNKHRSIGINKLIWRSEGLKDRCDLTEWGRGDKGSNQNNQGSDEAGAQKTDENRWEHTKAEVNLCK